MTITTNIKLGTILKDKITGQLVSVCMLDKGDNVGTGPLEGYFWDSENLCVGYESGYIALDEIGGWEIVEDSLRTPSGKVYEVDKHGNVLLGKRQLMIECNRCIVTAYLEQVFMHEGWQEVFDAEDALTMGLTDGAFGICEFIEAITHFLYEGCTAQILGLVKQA